MSQADRYLIVGESGSGKSVLAGELIDALEARPAFNRLVVLSTDDPAESPLAQRCAYQAEVTTELATRLSEGGLRRPLQDHGAGGVYLEVTATNAERVQFLEALGPAVMGLGHVLVVVDEAHSIADPKVGGAFLELWTRGRKKNITTIAITQSLKQRAAVGIHPTVLSRSSVLVVFRTDDPTGHEAQQIEAFFPTLAPYFKDLKHPRDGGLPEYGVRQASTGRALVRLRSGDVDLTPAQPSSSPAAVSA